VIRTFLDSGVLIAAFRSRNTVSTPVLTLLDDPERVFVTTNYVRLEVLPKPLYFRRETEAEVYEAFFAAAEPVEVLQALPLRKHDRPVLRQWMRSMPPRCAGLPGGPCRPQRRFWMTPICTIGVSGSRWSTRSWIAASSTQVRPPSTTARPGVSPDGRPLIGEHNTDIFCGELGLSRHELAMLAESRVI
jgi:hypothetical protein